MSSGALSCTRTLRSSRPPKLVAKSSEAFAQKSCKIKAVSLLVPLSGVLSQPAYSQGDLDANPMPINSPVMSTRSNPFGDNKTPPPPQSPVIATEAQHRLSQGRLRTSPVSHLPLSRTHVPNSQERPERLSSPLHLGHTQSIILNNGSFGLRRVRRRSHSYRTISRCDVRQGQTVPDGWRVMPWMDSSSISGVPLEKERERAWIPWHSAGTYRTTLLGTTGNSRSTHPSTFLVTDTLNLIPGAWTSSPGQPIFIHHIYTFRPYTSISKAPPSYIVSRRNDKTVMWIQRDKGI